MATEKGDDSTFTPLTLPINQILHVIKHQPWVKHSKLAKQDTESSKAGGCSFHGIREHATLHCWALKRHLEDLVQRGYLDEFFLNADESPEAGEAPSETVD